MIFSSINALQEIKPVLFDSSVREKRIEFSLVKFRVETMTDVFRILEEGKSSSQYYRHNLAQAAGDMAAEMK